MSRRPRWAGRRMMGRAGLALAGGGLAFLSLPPLGWWPAGVAGLGLLALVLRDCGPRRRVAMGYLFGAGLLVPGLWWVASFTAPGYPVTVLVEASFYGLAALVTPPRGAYLGLPAAVAGAEMLRDRWPFGGVPLAELSQGQVDGPFGQLARLGGAGLVTAGAVAVGAGLVGILAPRWSRTGAVALLAAVSFGLFASWLGPDGGPAVGHLRLAAVQGGGPRGLRAVNRDPALAFQAQVEAEASVRLPLRLVIWPENVLELDHRLDGSAEDAEMRSLATSAGATLVAGVTEPVGRTRFLNEVFAWTADGSRLGPYEKVHRVPFGEWVPFRSVLAHVANLSDVPRDAILGARPGYLRTPAGPLGFLISYEVFFDQRALAAVGAGARLMIVPTNAASYRSSQVPAMEVAASRLRAIGTGRDLVQAAPTGFSALIDHRGRVLARTQLGAAQVLETDRLVLRDGRTPFDRIGLAAVGWALLAALGLAWVRPRLRR